jgi:hypothetical protein
MLYPTELRAQPKATLVAGQHRRKRGRAYPSNEELAGSLGCIEGVLPEMFQPLFRVLRVFCDLSHLPF